MDTLLYRTSANTNADTDKATPLIDEETALTTAYNEAAFTIKHGTLDEIRCALSTWTTMALTNQGPSVDEPIISLTFSSSPIPIYALFKNPLPNETTRELLVRLQKVLNSTQDISPELFLKTMMVLKNQYTAEKDLTFRQMDTLLSNMDQRLLRSNQEVECGL